MYIYIYIYIYEGSDRVIVLIVGGNETATRVQNLALVLCNSQSDHILEKRMNPNILPQS